MVGLNSRIDFHSHILPGADHGSDGIDTSLSQLKLQKEAGITKVVATPHFYPESLSVDAFLSMRRKCADKLAEKLDKDAPEIYLGAEVLICDGLDEMKGLDKLCVEGTNTFLLEMPFSHFSDKILYTVEKMARLDLTVVMAHIDRYDEEDIEDLMTLPVLAQVNVANLAKRGTRKFLEKYFEAGRIVALGTDLHGAEERALKGYLKGLDKLGAFNEKEITSVTEQLLEGAVPLTRKEV